MMEEINNVYIFVADSLRWDALPEAAGSDGVVFKTVAQSLYSPPSFATLATGLYPQQHGVTGWAKQFPDGVKTFFDLEDVSTGFFQKSGSAADPIYDAVSVEGKTNLDELETPFFYMERDMTPHVPFNGYDSVAEYFDGIGGDYEKLQRDYRAAAERSFAKFQSRVEQIKDTLDEDDTMFVFTSDHGELLGEYGDVVHTFPACPELVYVPTVMMTPGGTDDVETAVESNGIIEHVDVVETIARRFTDDFQTAGADLFTDERSREWGYNFARSTRNGMTFYTADSIWWENAGYSRQTNRRTERLLLAIYMMTRSAEKPALWSDPMSLLKTYINTSHTFGDPPISPSAAENEIDDIRKTIQTREAEESALSDTSRDRLKDLGYIQ
ncbi:Type I phosphodiesterase / nucleotide pyrophosphatase [Halomicrobium zhouii]|uniref:Type I phosphodiesterase / nucleotide pyrophosphatase n=1 Tax=Halomicrobium zhouii TaxID=767519 RepID=A0A1I6K8H5_9EURY|nr:sulfatase-like hydrolase/transferase [Halomicrobium zhouii]SFR87519.1 Type I phosphodiesterase / nucleotide pyrophosphatase [Halomicrobium zhouii]